MGEKKLHREAKSVEEDKSRGGTKIARSLRSKSSNLRRSTCTPLEEPYAFCQGFLANALSFFSGDRGGKIEEGRR
jgi:hypothetical protein